MTPPAAAILSLALLVAALPDAAAAVWNPGRVDALDWPSAKGWPVETWLPRKTATLADLDGDGAAEILFVGSPARDSSTVLLVALRGNGRPLRGWPQPTGMAYPSGPLVGDLDGDGKVEVLVTDGTRVAVWSAGGKPRFRPAAEIPGGPADLHNNSEPALADLDGDGRPELVFAAWGPRVFAVRLAGAPASLSGFPLTLEGEFGASPAVADLDGDGREEIVIANEGSACYFIRWRPAGVAVERARDAAGAPLALGSRSSAAIGDLDGDGALSVVLGTYAGHLVALDATGRERWRFTVEVHGVGLSENIHSSPALVDLDGDGRREVVFAAYDQRLRALDSRGQAVPGWEGAVLDNCRSGVVAGDVDGDRRPEVLVPDFEGNVFVFKPGGEALGYLEGPSWNPLLGDVDADGRLELVLPLGRVGVDVLELPGRPKGPAPWPMHRVDARHSGAAAANRPAAAAPKR